MNCKRIREFLITDYMDKEAPESAQKEIAAHLKICFACRNFQQSLLERVSQPLKKLGTVQPPVQVWERIKEAIEEDKQYAPSFLERLWDYLGKAFTLKKPAFTFSTVVSVILVSVLISQVAFRQQRLVKEYLTEQSQFILSLQWPVNGNLNQETSFGTAIERNLF